MPRRTSRRCVVASIIFAAAILAAPWPAAAVNTKSQKDESEADFKEGQLKSTSLSSDGVLTIAPALKKLFDSREGIVWDVIEDGRGGLFAATGHHGKVFHYSDDKPSTATLVCDLPEVEATALALDAKKNLYIGASPGGAIYRVRPEDKPGTATLFFKTKQAYVWDLAFDPKGDLYAATGTEGKIFTIDPQGKGEVLYDSKAVNILSLDKTGDKPLLAATQNPGTAIEITRGPDGKAAARVLIDGSPYDEIRQVIRGKEGAVYVVMNPSQEAPKSLAELLSKSSKPASAPSGPSKGPKPRDSQIAKINANGFVQTIWWAPESPIHSIRFNEKSGRLLAGAGKKGGLYEVREDGDWSTLLTIEQKSIMTLAPNGAALAVGTAESGFVCRIAPEGALEGLYISPTIDGGDPVKWGALRMRGQTPEGSSIMFSLRTGNTTDPEDGTWSPWSADSALIGGALPIAGPPARLVQYRATLKRPKADSPSPSLDLVEVFYLTSNLPPIIKQLKTEPPGHGPRPASGAAGGDGPSGEGVAMKPNSNPKGVQISWSIDEPNDDEVEANLRFRGEEETTWKKINKEPLRGPSSYPFKTASIPDGIYRVRLVVSDKPSNPPDEALEAQRISDPFTVDNTPPRIDSFELKPAGGMKRRLAATAVDSTSIISDAQYCIDAGDWQVAYPADRVFDSLTETFDIPVEFDSPGEHVVTLQATDREGNTQLAKKVVRIAASAPASRSAP